MIQVEGWYTKVEIRNRIVHLTQQPCKNSHEQNSFQMFSIRNKMTLNEQGCHM
jgi:hypothetical protein